MIEEKKRTEEREEEKQKEKERAERFKKKNRKLQMKSKKLKPSGDEASRQVREAEIVTDTPNAPDQKAIQEASDNENKETTDQSKKEDEEEMGNREDEASDTGNRIRERALVPATQSLSDVEKKKEKKQKKKEKLAKKKKSSQKSSIEDRPPPPKYDWPTCLYANSVLAVLDIPTLRFSGMDVLGDFKILSEDEWIPIPPGGYALLSFLFSLSFLFLISFLTLSMHL